MFSRWGAFVYRARRPIVVGSLLVAVAMGFFATNASSHLSSGGWLDPASESARVADRLAADFGTGRSTIVVLFRGPSGTDAAGADFQKAIATTLDPVTGDPNVAGIAGCTQTGDRRFIGPKGDAAYAVIELNSEARSGVGRALTPLLHPKNEGEENAHPPK